MELWRDELRGRWYMLDAKTGQHFPCDRYGQPLKEFRKDLTGHFGPKEWALRQHTSYSPKTQRYDPLYTAQPKKFDGYSQFPRPKSEVCFNDKHSMKTLKPVPRGQMPSNRLPSDIQFIPKPASFLTFSAIDDNTVQAPTPRVVLEPLKDVVPEKLTVEGLRSTLVKPPETMVKTASHFHTTMEAEKRQMTGYQPPVPKPERRKLKGFFQLVYPTSADRYKKDIGLWRATNPTAFEAQRHFEELDRKNLEKRKEQRMLKTRLLKS